MPPPTTPTTPLAPRNRIVQPLPSNTPGGNTPVTPAQIAGICVAVVLFVFLILLRCYCAGRELKRKRRELVRPGAGPKDVDDEEITKLLHDEDRKKLVGGRAMWKQFWKGSGYSKTVVGTNEVQWTVAESGPRREGWGARK